MIFDKVTKTILLGIGQSFQQMVLGKLDIHMQKDKVGCLPNTIFTDQFKMDLAPKFKTLNTPLPSKKTLRENVG